MTDLFVTEKVRIADLIPSDINPRKIKESKKRELWLKLQKYGFIGIPVRDADGTLLSGHQRCSMYLAYGFGDKEIDVRTAIRKLTKDEEREIMLIENTHSGEFDLEILHAEFAEYVDLEEFGLNVDELIKDIQSNEVTEQAEMPIVSKLSEKYTSFVIVCSNEIDENHLAEKLGIDRAKCYKSDRVGMTHVVSAKQVIERWK